jgi:hypothetical protein
MAKYIASKLSFDQTFDLYDNKHPPYRKIKSILVKGRSNVRDPHTLVMPEGVITEISDEDAEIMERDPLYKQYEANGMMKLVNSKAGARSAKADLAEKDGAAQLTEKDYRKRGKTPPKAVQKDDGEGDAE